jgi:hypothetical protein
MFDAFERTLEWIIVVGVTYPLIDSADAISLKSISIALLACQDAKTSTFANACARFQNGPISSPKEHATP